MGPPSVGRNLEGFTGACGFEQSVAQPRCIGPLKIEGIVEDVGLVPTSRVRRVQAIVRDFANIEDRLIAVRQTRRHSGRVASLPLRRSTSAVVIPGILADVQSRFGLANHGVAAKQ
jgi:hypothetical protein